MASLEVQDVLTTSMNDIDQTDNTKTDFRRVIDTANQDVPGSSYITNWAKWFGYYKNVPELQAVINKKAIWTVGKGYETDAKTKEMLSKIKGFGKDTFNEIIKNLIVQYTTCGDGYAEIIKKGGELINLKPLDPGNMTILTNGKGIIEGYDYTVFVGERKFTTNFKPEEIFHLPWNRLGAESHGRSTIEKIEEIILMKNEAMIDIKTVFHRYVKPLIVSKIDSDDATVIAAFKTKLDAAVENMENLIIPKDTVEMERVAIPQYATLDPLPWIKLLQSFFLMAEGVPDVILGLGKEVTEASAKIVYLAFQQNIEDNQRFLEDNIKTQLGLDVEFNFPASLEEPMQEDRKKARSMTTMPDKGVMM